MSGKKTPSYIAPLVWWAVAGTAAVIVAGVALKPFFATESMPLFGAVMAGLASVMVFSLGRIAELLRDESLKSEKIADMVTAIYAEITASDFSADLQASEASERYALIMVRGIEDVSQEPEIPFAVPDQSNFVFDALTNDLSLLPQEIIHPIVLYYKLALQTNDYVRTLENPVFRALPSHRRAKFVADLVGLNRAQSEQGDRALEAIASFAGSIGLKLPIAAETKARLKESTPNRTDHDSFGWTGRGSNGE